MDTDNESTIELKEWRSRYKYLYLPPLLASGEEKSFKVLDKAKKGSFTLENFFLIYANEWFKHKNDMSCMSLKFNEMIKQDIIGVDLADSNDPVIE